MEDPTHDYTNDQEGNRYVLLVFVVEDCVEASVDAIARINLQPKEEVVGLLVRPNDFNYYS